MAETWSKEDIEKSTQAIWTKASKDVKFRAKCLTDPKGAIQEVSGKALPPNLNIKFVENKGATYTFVLPDPVTESQELSEAELEQVAGGRCGASCAGGTAASAGVCVSCAATCAGATCAGTTLSISIGLPGVGCVAGF